MARYIFDMESDGFIESMTTVHSLVLHDIDQGFTYTCTDHDYDSERENHFELDIKSGLKLLEEADEVIGHNIIKFDIPAIQKIYPWFSIDESKVTDTLVISRLIWSNLADKDFDFRRKNPKFPGNLIGRHSLEAWGHRLGLHKGDYAKEMEAKGLDPWVEWNVEMQSYCELDVEVTHKLYRLIQSKKYSLKAIMLEHQFQHIIFKQEQYGFPFNVKGAERLYAELAGIRLELEDELQKVFKPWLKFAGKNEPKRSMKRFIKNPHGAHEKTDTHNNLNRGYYEYITEGLSFCKIKLVTFNAGSRDHIGDRLKAIHGWKPTEFGKDGKPTINDEIIQALPYPEAELLGRYLMIQKRIGQLAEGANANLRLVKENGHIHGQVITNGAVTGRCTHNRPNVAQTPATGVPYGSEFRRLYYAPKGWKLVGADASGLELRCLGHFMARYDNGAYIKEILEGDIHTANQIAAGLPTRPNAKTFIYAFLYGAGDAKIGSIVGKGAQAGKQLKARFLKRTPALKRLREDVQAKVKSTGKLTGLDGRILHIRSAHSALNLIFQSAGALIMKKATVIFYEDATAAGYFFGHDYALVAHIHDEMQTLVKDGLEDVIGKLMQEAIVKAGKYFKFRCPTDAEYKVGSNWAETH